MKQAFERAVEAEEFLQEKLLEDNIEFMFGKIIDTNFTFSN